MAPEDRSVAPATTQGKEGGRGQDQDQAGTAQVLIFVKSCTGLFVLVPKLDMWHSVSSFYFHPSLPEQVWFAQPLE